MYQKPAAPNSIGGVLDDGFRLTRESYPKVFLIALVGAYLSNIPNFLVSSNAEDPLASFTTSFVLLSLIGSLLSLYAFAWAICRVDAVADGRDAGAAETARQALGRYPLMLAVFVIYMIIIMLGYIALLIPGIILTLNLMFAPYACVLDNEGFVDAFKRSHQLVWGNWWRTAATITVVFFILFILYALVIVVAGFSVAFQNETDTLMVMLELFIVPILTALFMPVVYACTVAIYNDLKLRKQGDDLEARLAATETPAS